jgi:iron complex transport system substrate-binding protein
MRAFAAGAACIALPGHSKATPRKIVSLDFGIASTLLSLGVVPAAVSELADWDRWLVEPKMPDGVIDLGSSWEANFEILTMLRPDLILTTPYLDEVLPKLQTVAPVLRLDVFSPQAGPILPASIAATRKLAAAIGREAEGERYLASSDAFFDTCRKRLALQSPPPVALVNFMDARHARIYGDPGLFDNVLVRIGLRNAWTEPSNYWGYQTISIEELSRISDRTARLIAFEPIPGDVMPKLRQSPLWQDLPFARPGHFSTLPPALMFGMVNEAMRFARLLTDKLESVE